MRCHCPERRRVRQVDVRQGRLRCWWSHAFQRLGNEYYKTEEEFIYACADALREEYKAIVDAGLVLQIDDPSIAENWDQITPEPSADDYRRFAQIRVDAINHALQGIPGDRVRVHICWGSWHGPHTTDIEFRHIVDLVLQINAQGYSFEAANARHEHIAWAKLESLAHGAEIATKRLWS